MSVVPEIIIENASERRQSLGYRGSINIPVVASKFHQEKTDSSVVRINRLSQEKMFTGNQNSYFPLKNHWPSLFSDIFSLIGMFKYSLLLHLLFHNLVQW